MTVTEERAILAGGCFWGMQHFLRRLPGVISTRVGYTGGDVPDATYANHGSHAEAIEIFFDPRELSYRRLLECFFQVHDPTTLDRQGNDEGPSYRSAIFYTSEQQRRTAEETIADVNSSGRWPGKVVTEVEPAGSFGRPSPSTKITWSAIPAATTVTLFGLSGGSQTEGTHAGLGKLSGGSAAPPPARSPIRALALRRLRWQPSGARGLSLQDVGSPRQCPVGGGQRKSRTYRLGQPRGDRACSRPSIESQAIVRRTVGHRPIGWVLVSSHEVCQGPPKVLVIVDDRN